jgi:hypothetical protein
MRAKRVIGPDRILPHVPIAAAFNDPTRVATRKVVLLITDGKPTAMKRDTDAQCKQDPKTGAPVAAWSSGSFPNGCLMDANDANGGYATRSTLSHGSLTNANGSSFFLNTISCFRSLHDCDPGGINSNGVMYESDLIRNCGASNAACSLDGSPPRRSCVLTSGEWGSPRKNCFSRNSTLP